MNTIRAIVLLAALLAATPATGAPRAKVSARLAPAVLVAIQPLGDVSPAVVHRVVEHLRSVFAVQIEVLSAQAMPASAYYAPRARYRGERILDHLEARTPSRASKVLGLTARDVSASKGRIHDWGVLGIAGLGKRAAVVSTHRLGSRGPERRTTRLNQVAAHELGHTFGLRHCSSARCIMEDACGTIRTVDRSSGRFCDGCRRRIGYLLREQGTVGA